MVKKKKLLLLSNIPAPYMIDYLNELANYYEITALFEMMGAKDRDKNWFNDSIYKFNIVNLKAFNLNKESGISLKQIKYLSNKKFDNIIIANPTTATGIMSLLYCRLFKIHFIIQSEGGFQGTGKGLKEKFKKFIMEKADIYLSGMRADNDYFLMYGGNKDTIKTYPFSSLRKDQLVKKLPTFTEKNRVKEELNIREQQIVLTVGRFIESKGFDVLLKAFSKLDSSIGLYLIGGKPTDDYLKIISECNISNVYFVDFCDYQVIEKYYSSADLFVLPTRGDTWGLVINEAMSNGLPIITTNKCIAGLELIENEKNGYVIDVDDVNYLYHKMHDLLNNKDLLSRMSENNFSKIQNYTIENMAKTIYKHLKEYDIYKGEK